MSVCSLRLKPCPPCEGVSYSEDSDKVLIQDEVIWGLTYRNYKDIEKNKISIPPMKSPVDIPFKLCRYKQQQQMQKRKRRKKLEQESAGQSETKILMTQRPVKPKYDLLELSTMSQRKYMDYLAIPNKIVKAQTVPKLRLRIRCTMDPCPPRLVQMSIPNKRRVFANWKDYYTLLPAEMINRFEKILHSDQNLEPKDARFYFKKLDKQKRRQKRANRQLKRKKELDKQRGDKKWMDDQIKSTADLIVDYFKSEPLLALNYKQMLLSDGILSMLANKKKLKKPSRKTKNHYKKTVIDISDKVAVWIDTLTRFVDVQAVDSDQDIPSLALSSLAEEEGEEEESATEYSSSEFSSSEGEEETGMKKSREGFPGEEAGYYSDLFKEPDLLHGPKGVHTVHGGESGEFDDFSKLDTDSLEKLIQILSNSPDEFLDNEIMPSVAPGRTYREALEELKRLRDRLLQQGPRKPHLEKVMIDWAMKNNPEEVDDKIREKIAETACLLAEVLFRGSLPTKGLSEGDVTDTEGFTATEGEGGLSSGLKSLAEGEGPLSLTVEREGEGEGEGEGGEGGEEKGQGEAEGNATDTEGELTEGPTDITEEGGELSGADADLTEGDADLLTEAEGDEGEGGPTGKEGEGEMEGEPLTEELGEGEGVTEGESIAGKPSALEAEGEETTYGGGGEDGEATTEPYQGFSTEGEGEGDEGEGEGERVPVEETIDAVYSRPLFHEAGEEDKISDKDSKEKAKEKIVEPVKKGMRVGLEEDEVEFERSRPPTGDKECDGFLGEGVIKGHKPLKVVEHEPGTVCCLSLKIWAVWLLEITHNAHNWTKWIAGIIRQVREYAAIIRGDIILPSGEKKVLKKAEWREFSKETEEMSVAWRKYSDHVKQLSGEIIENFHGKDVKCCPKCLQEHLIKNVVTAHKTLQALTEAINCAGYWQRCLDQLVSQAAKLSGADSELFAGVQPDEVSITSDKLYDLEELSEFCSQPCPCRVRFEEVDDDSMADFEELEGEKQEDEAVAPKKKRRSSLKDHKDKGKGKRKKKVVIRSSR